VQQYSAPLLLTLKPNTQHTSQGSPHPPCPQPSPLSDFPPVLPQAGVPLLRGGDRGLPLIIATFSASTRGYNPSTSPTFGGFRPPASELPNQSVKQLYQFYNNGQGKEGAWNVGAYELGTFQRGLSGFVCKQKYSWEYFWDSS
jgi:hypothetical protein